MEFQVSLTPRAERDLEQIGRYLALTDSELAHRFCKELSQEAKSLHILPQRGQPIGRKPGIRKLVCGNYLIIYKITETKRNVEILRFWHDAQNQQRLRLREEASAFV